MPSLKSRWKPVAWLTAIVVGVPALMLVCGVLYFVHDEGNQVYRSRLYRAKYEITAIDAAAESFHKKYGSYPTDLQELIHTARDGGNDRQFLARIAPNPWGGQFLYAVEHGANGESIKICVRVTVPGLTYVTYGLPTITSAANVRGGDRCRA